MLVADENTRNFIAVVIRVQKTGDENLPLITLRSGYDSTAHGVADLKNKTVDVFGSDGSRYLRFVCP
jgi:hypothetical protein